MTEELRPDGAEQDLADQMDDAVPSYGYSRVPVVGLGGSAGSIEALQTFFTNMPAKSALAFVVVIHLSPEHESLLPELLQRCTAMPVVQVRETVTVEAGTIYVIPPGKIIQSADGHLRLSDVEGVRARHVAVDVFFRTLADSHGPHSAAVVLSGMDGDGAIGIKRIKERGGLTVAQDPDEAAHGGMPRAAIGTGMVDWVLPVRDMPARLLGYFRMEKALLLPAEDPQETPRARTELDAAELRDVLSFLRTRTGRDFSSYKRATVLRRIGRRMQVNGIDNLRAYLNCLRTRTGESEALLQDLLISVTNFFRDADCFAALATHIPRLFEGKGPGDVVRVWVVACATGEEAYSLAMLLSDHARTLEAPPMIQVFATDLDEDAIRTAREGIYPAAITADVSEEHLRRHFLKEHRGYRVRRELRELVLFALHDVLKDSPFSRLDLVTCRNLLIYLTRDAQAKVMQTLHFSLVPDGKMMLGSSESVDEGVLFNVLDKKHRIYVQKPTARGGMPIPSGPATLKLALEAQQAAREGPVISGHAIKGASGLQEAVPAPALRDAPRISWGEMHLRLVERLAPPSVVVDSNHDIVHLSPSAGRFLQFAGGEPSRNLLRAVQADLRMELRAALYQSNQTRETTEMPGLPMMLGGRSTVVDLRVQCVEEGEQPLFLVIFDPHPHGPAEAPRAVRLEADPLARHLDQEVERLKAHLRETVEQYEASGEELKASNEELQAINEELRAATEELETSREELQSINEELTTVNQELKSKVDQLSHANSDMHNLMDATAIATVFLDRELRITRYTPSAVSLFNLIPSDLGRPLTDMASHLDYAALGDDARQVLSKLTPVEREVSQGGSKWYLVRVMPYRTLDDRIAGVVFTFVDVSAARQAATALRLSEERFRLLVENAREYAIFSLDLERRVTTWSTGAERTLGFSESEVLGQPVDFIFTPEDRAQGVPERECRTALAEGRASDERRHQRKDGSLFLGSGVMMVMRDAAGVPFGFVKILRDRSDQPPQP